MGLNQVNCTNYKMTDKLNPKTVALSLASVAGIVYIICAILVIIAPRTMLNLFKYMFHGIDITQIARTTTSLGGTVVGFVETIFLSLVVGWLFAVIYNYFLSRIE